MSNGTPKRDPKKMICPGPTPGSDQWHAKATCDTVTAEKIGGQWKPTDAASADGSYRCVAHPRNLETYERQKNRAAAPPRHVRPQRELPPLEVQRAARLARHRAEERQAEQDAINRRVSAAIAAEMHEKRVREAAAQRALAQGQIISDAT